MKSKRFSGIAIAIYSSLFLSQVGSATEDWQFVNGPNYSFKLPDRPVGSQKSFDLIMNERLQPKTTLFRVEKIEEAQKHCPLSVEIFERVMKKIVTSNSLANFINHGPSISLKVKCNIDMNLARLGFIPTGPYSTVNYIILPADILRVLSSEEEIAFVLAHEISHILLGHTEVYMDFSLRENKVNPFTKEGEIFRDEVRTLTSSFEPAADKFGAMLAINAGYSPACIGITLAKIESLYSGEKEKSGHGSPRARQKKIDTQLGLRQKCERSESEIILAARNELDKYDDASK